MTRLYLIILALALLMGWFVNSRFDPLNAVSETAYDVQGLNDLVGSLDSKSEKVADLWHITDADLDSHIDIFGERK